MRLLLLVAKRFKLINPLIVVTAILLAVPAFAGHIEKMDISGVTLDVYVPDIPAPRLSEDGKTLWNFKPVILVDDPNPANRSLRIPPPAEFQENTLDPLIPTATFAITYTPAGSADPWLAVCETFPDEAKAAFNAAGSIWASLLSSSVPVAITACWSNLGAVSTLGYSGGGVSYRNFPNAPRANTWYGSSLANSLAGSDLDASKPDMYITYNSNFSWYYGTDGNTPPGQHDLMSVVLHEIAHGLNFSGTMSYSGGQGSWGAGSGYPNIYDTFVYDGTGNQLINTGVYPNPSLALGSALTSGDLYFHGSNAMAANGGAQVKMYAPPIWSSGSSYSHLDYSTFGGTVNALMVYAISAGVSIHDPGPVTKGLLKDLGWSTGTNPTQPDLIPYTPTGWSSPLVISKTSGTSSDDAGITSADSLYVDWAAVNASAVNISTGFYVSLQVDGVEVYNWSVASLEAGYYAYDTDHPLGKLSAGSHTISMVVDSTNAVAEGNEGNNVYTKTLFVSQALLPNLKGYRPSGWGNKLVVTHYQGDKVDSKLYAGYKIYVDWAIANFGKADISKKFYIRLYIDGVMKKTWATSSLKKNYYRYLIGYYIGGLSRGSHQIKIVADTPNRILESKETDNTCVRTVRVY
jgi:hypothetical protein